MSLTDINWTLVATSVTAAALVFSIISFLLNRRKETAWKRTEFLFSQWQYLDNDQILIEVVTILEGRHPSIKLTDVYDPTSDLDESKRMEYLRKFDKLLNFLARFCYAYLTVKTFSKKEIQAFDWYFRRIGECSHLVEYCENNGYEEINLIIKELGLDN